MKRGMLQCLSDRVINAMRNYLFILYPLLIGLCCSSQAVSGQCLLDTPSERWKAYGCMTPSLSEVAPKDSLYFMFRMESIGQLDQLKAEPDSGHFSIGHKWVKDFRSARDSVLYSIIRYPFHKLTFDEFNQLADEIQRRKKRAGIKDCGIIGVD